MSVREEQRAEVRRILGRRKGVRVGLRFHHVQAFQSGLTQRSGEAEPAPRGRARQSTNPRVGRGGARDLGVGRDLLIRLKPSGGVSVCAYSLALGIPNIDTRQQ